MAAFARTTPSSSPSSFSQAQTKAIVAYFHRSTAGIQDLASIQASLQLPVKKPVQDVATRWFSSFPMVEWFQEQREAVQMYDVKFGSEASKNDAYKDNRLQHADWTNLDQSLAVLTPLAHATKHLEGTQYVTVSLVLPYIYRLIDSTADGALRLPWKVVLKNGCARATLTCVCGRLARPCTRT
jgi:hypothetical protein